MSKDKEESPQFDELRKRAGKRIKRKVDDLCKQPTMAHDWIVQALQVYQVELDMQNEELRRAQVELQQSSKRNVSVRTLLNSHRRIPTRSCVSQ
jgi:hypothetical protein